MTEYSWEEGRSSDSTNWMSPSRITETAGFSVMTTSSAPDAITSSLEGT